MIIKLIEKSDDVSNYRDNYNRKVNKKYIFMSLIHFIKKIDLIFLLDD